MAGMAEINELNASSPVGSRATPRPRPCGSSSIAHPSPITSWKAQERSRSTLAASSTRPSRPSGDVLQSSHLRAVSAWPVVPVVP